MHIPSTKSQLIEIEDFYSALEKSELQDHIRYNVEQWLYVPNTYSEYRYILGTRGEKPLICVGVNPSTAAPGDLDNTLKSVERIALGNGYDSFIMFNVYAQRATDPDAMERHCNQALHAENLEAFRYVLSIAEKPAVWAAWGTIIEKRDYLPRCLQDMLSVGAEHNARWYCAGADKTGDSLSGKYCGCRPAGAGRYLRLWYGNGGTGDRFGSPYIGAPLSALQPFDL
mgnify:CR=1 FL=1